MTSARLPLHLLRSIEKGRCVLFVGAGVSYEAGLPTASELGEMLADETGYPTTFPHSLLDIGQYYQEMFGRASLVNKLSKVLQKHACPSETHMLIAALTEKFKLIITTNYDSLLEEALLDIEYPFYIIREAVDLPNAPMGTDVPIIFKIHGSLDTRNIVLTRDDYYRYFGKSLKSALGAFLKAQLAIGTFLFVGYSLRDYNFVSLFESVRNELEDYMPQGFAAMPSPDPVEAHMWLKRGIKIIDTTARDLFEQINKSFMAPRPGQVFLSYDFEDQKWAERIQLELEERGIKTFSPLRDIHLGENISEKITRKMVQSRAVIVLLSPRYVRSDWGMRELRIALSLRKGKILPILINDCKIPEKIRHIKYLDGRVDFSSAMNELVGAINKI